MNIHITPANKEQDHKALVRFAAKSKYTRDFSNELMFSSEAAYNKGWILKCVDDEGNIIGMSCVRHKSREPVTMVYFIIVAESVRGMGIGRKLLKQLVKDGPHTTIQLSVMKDNTEAMQFYKRLGFKIVGETMKGKANLLQAEEKDLK